MASANDRNSPASTLTEFICSGCLGLSGSLVMRRLEHVVVRCSGCGLAHMLPRPMGFDDSHQLDDLGYYDGVMRQFRRGLSYHSTKLLRLLHAYSPPPGSLLEIGCATGLFLMDAQKAGYSVLGLEPAAGHRQLISAEIASSVLPHRLEDARFSEATFDVVVAIQLLEHLVDPAVFAEQLKRVLKPNAIAYVETPNFDCVSGGYSFSHGWIPTWLRVIGICSIPRVWERSAAGWD